MTTIAVTNVIPEEAHLEFRQGPSDKVYHLALAQCETGWCVIAAWGRRGSTLSTDAKVERTDYEAAKKLYDATLRAKLAKGYKQTNSPSQGSVHSGVTAAAQPSPSVPETGAAPSSLGPALTRARKPVSKDVVFAAELLTRITSERELGLYAVSPRYLFQIKRDGVRLTIVAEKIDGSALYEIWGYNKLGQVVQLDARLYAAVKKLCTLGKYERLMMDGEWESSGFWGWDLLELDGDLRGMAYEDRFQAISEMFRDLDLADLQKMFHVVESADTQAGKLALLAKAKATRAEGLAVKLRTAQYRGGRSSQHYKFKFEQTASFIVGPKPKHKANDGHRSVALYVIDKGQRRFVATVKVADRYSVPPENSVVDARYLYAHEGGGIVQPCLFWGHQKRRATKRLCRAAVKNEAGFRGSSCVMARPSNPRPSPEQRFWSYVKKTPTCWLWTGPRTPRGYGYFKIGARRILAARFAWELTHKVRLGRYKSRHTCDNPPCVRFEHIVRGTQRQNVDDCRRRKRFRGWHGAEPGSAHPLARLTPEQASVIKDAPKVRGIQRQLAKQFHVSEAQVSLMRRGLSWKAGCTAERTDIRKRRAARESEAERAES